MYEVKLYDADNCQQMFINDALMDLAGVRVLLHKVLGYSGEELERLCIAIARGETTGVSSTEYHNDYAIKVRSVS